MGKTIKIKFCSTYERQWQNLKRDDGVLKGYENFRCMHTKLIL